MEKKPIKAGRAFIELGLSTTELEKGLAKARAAIAKFGRQLAALDRPKAKGNRKQRRAAKKAT